MSLMANVSQPWFHLLNTERKKIKSSKDDDDNDDDDDDNGQSVSK